ncbi:MAG: hypothetical protein JO063_13980 [Pseudonocardiales bacterium]|nr:hypothetical protein [Pseudonocardiales bacterium]MBV9032790.1 hypothetical protein [Pseudonocardiales bacterium]MBW0011196.1 hypothetical protein [Pseudonocardiales bacterium]
MSGTPPIAVTLVQATHLLATHLSEHALAQPASLEMISEPQRSRVTAQVHSLTVPSIAAELLAWADTLPTVTAQAWRPPCGDRVHLSMASTLNGPAGTVELTVYGGADHDPAVVGDLAPGEYRAVTLDALRAWAADAPHPLPMARR